MNTQTHTHNPAKKFNTSLAWLYVARLFTLGIAALNVWLGLNLQELVQMEVDAWVSTTFLCAGGAFFLLGIWSFMNAYTALLLTAALLGIGLMVLAVMMLHNQLYDDFYLLLIPVVSLAFIGTGVNIAGNMEKNS